MGLNKETTVKRKKQIPFCMVDVDSSGSCLIFFMGGGRGGGAFERFVLRETEPSHFIRDACIKFKEGYISYGTEFQK